MTKIRQGLSVCTYACLSIGLAAMVFSLLWIALGGPDSGMLHNAILMMYLSVAGAMTVTLIELGATATHVMYRRFTDTVLARVKRSA